MDKVQYSVIDKVQYSVMDKVQYSVMDKVQYSVTARWPVFINCLSKKNEKNLE